jgi:hypothetical protein
MKNESDDIGMMYCTAMPTDIEGRSNSLRYPRLTIDRATTVEALTVGLRDRGDVGRSRPTTPRK